MKNSKILLGFLVLVMAAGCSVDASLKSLLNSAAPGGISLQKATGAEFVSGSLGQYQDSPLRHYKIESAVGSFITKPIITTPGRGYKVYSSVQSSVISDEIN